MVKVGLYEARGLAKQAVGTPGIDKTGAIVENFGGDLLKATDDYIRAENAKIKIADNILAETEKIKWENELFNQVEQAKQDPDNINNPMGLADSILIQLRTPLLLTLRLSQTRELERCSCRNLYLR